MSSNSGSQYFRPSPAFVAVDGELDVSGFYRPPGFGQKQAKERIGPQQSQ
jgi:hypothetical protein